MDRRTLLAMLAVGAANVLVACTHPARGSVAIATSPPKPTGTPTVAHPTPTGTVAATPTFPPIPPPRPGPPQVVFQAPGPTRRIALTIDDGYSTETVAGYVEFAMRSGIPITFSPNGAYRAIWDPHSPALRPLIERGQVQIGNHTWTHKDMVVSTDAAVRTDIESNEDWIQRTFGITSRPWLRPPYGSHNVRTDRLAGDLGFTRIVMWNGSFGDSLLLKPDVLLAQAQRYLQPGVIMLGHANHATILSLFSQVEDLIAQRRLEPVTLDGMFHTSRAIG